MPTDRFQPGGSVLITGASSGIGLELAKPFAAAKHPLILTARNAAALEQLAQECRQSHGVEAQVITADLADVVGPQFLFDEIQRRGLCVDILVNNAGFGTHGRFWEIATRNELSLLQVNVVALVQLTHLFLPGMVARKRGKVLNVASTAAFQPGPLMANYYASKAYVLSFSEALSNELAGTGVTVTALCPGPTSTDFQKRAGIGMSKISAIAGMSAQAVAQAGYDAVMNGKRVCIPGWKNRLLARSSKWLPRSLVLNAVRRLNASR
jgi:short-subunit dehydrogenase